MLDPTKKKNGVLLKNENDICADGEIISKIFNA